MQSHADGTLTLPGSVIAIGAFDGVHQGHQAVIRQALHRSEMLGVPSLVYTFDLPPRSFFQGARMLTTLEEKLDRIARLGIDHTVIARFDEAYASRSSTDFINNLSELNPLEIMIGQDFRFGKNREGDIALLERYFKVRVMQPVCCSEGKPISSTRIRQLISDGEIQQSFTLLGWLHLHKISC
ncbi:FAD synthetase family protein [Paenibacillus aceris]|uniref:FAD synthase n=1 Tax=Paenibacillus aceris TaxID=869555 RepID=A0ABS4I271_9BACL|nr:riboflavin kinase/FMN adenylyltransferase [Paenibacillus aceris]NHW35668.1 FAD synthetase family protein [Paenibacillus aceris]